MTHFWPIRVIKRILHYGRLIRELKPDVIYSFGYVSKYTTFAYFISRCKGVKIIASERSDPNSVPSNLLMKKVRDWCYSKADVLVCQTNQAAEYFKARIKTNIDVIPNPITPNLPYWSGLNSFDIVAACRLDQQKNLPMLLKAFKKFHQVFPQYKLTIYGKGDLKDELETEIKNSALENYVSLPGATKDIHRIFAKSFMFVSSSNHEGMSNSMLEALAIGVPSVCTNCPIGGAAMVVKNFENGLLVPVGDENAFYEAMKYIVEHKESLMEMSGKAQSLRSILNSDVIASRWIDLMNKNEGWL